MTGAVTSDKEWRVEEDLRTLCRAAEIKRDPARMKACKAMARKRKAELEKVFEGGGGAAGK